MLVASKSYIVVSKYAPTSAAGLKEENFRLAAKRLTATVLKHVKPLVVLDWVVVDVRDFT